METIRRGSPPPGVAQLEPGGRLQRFSALALVFLPLAAVVYAVGALWNRGVGWMDLALAAGFYLVTGHGLSAGFHRLFSHRSFKASRPLKIALAVAGSMAIEGSLFTWVAQHRRHHAHADRAGDPHSPWRFGTGLGSQARGLVHAHAGWMFAANPSEPERWIPDLLADPDLAFVSRTAVLWSAVSLALPFLAGLAITRSLSGAWLALVWAGGVRLAVLHHVTWGVNSLAHMFGRQPYRTRDRSSNLAALSILSFGDSWHNAHHAHPNLARHGVDRHQVDSSAALIRVFERLGWASDARWPDPAVLAARKA